MKHGESISQTNKRVRETSRIQAEIMQREREKYHKPLNKSAWQIGIGKPRNA